MMSSSGRAEKHPEVVDFPLRDHLFQLGGLELQRVIISLEDDDLIGIVLQLIEYAGADSGILLDHDTDHIVGILKVDILCLQRLQILLFVLFIAIDIDCVDLFDPFYRQRSLQP